MLTSRLSGWRLRLAQVAWLALVGLSLALYVLGLPRLAVLLRQPCAGEGCAYGQLAPPVAAELASVGLSLGAYAAAYLTLHVVAALLALGVGALIFARRRDEPAALAMSLMLITLSQSNVVQYRQGLEPWLTVPLQVLGWVTASCLPAVFYTFPDGRFVPRWTRWAALAWVALMAVDNFWTALLPALVGENLLGHVFIAFFASFALALVVRFRRAGLAERQQIKWVVFGGGLALTLFAAFTVIRNLAGLSLLAAAQPVTDFLFNALLALAVGLAILRYRLWDIDLLINRALVYGLLTLALTMVYFGSVVAFQSALRLVSGENTTLASVASTLLLAALFRPLRARVQTSIDRRFYRRRYNAGQVLARFGVLLRDDAYADLDQATGALLGVVADTLQPSHVSLWLSPASAQAGRARRPTLAP